MIELNKIYNEDCLEGMKRIEDKSIDMILCDLPYGTTACVWDTIIPFEKLWEQYNRIIKDTGAIVLFGQEPFSSFLRLSNIKNYKYDWYWQKERPTNVMQIKKRAGKVIETISVFYKNQCTYNPQKTQHGGKLRTNKIKNGTLGKLIDSKGKESTSYRDDRTRYPLQLLKFNRDILVSNLHPTQKPLALFEYLVNTYTNEGETVLDNCIGSGTTAIACINTNRNFIGFELDTTYCDIANRRIQDIVSKTQ
jgi:site-specific DNA-methyltransferase (adenine-specific)